MGWNHQLVEMSYYKIYIYIYIFEQTIEFDQAVEIDQAVGSITK